MSQFVMPSLGADMEAGTLVAWLKQPGDKVERGDIIAEVDTDKGVIEVEVFESGVVDRLLVEPGTKVPVGTPLAVIAGAGAPAVAHAPAPPAAAPVAPVPSVPAVSAHIPVVTRAPSRLRISPAARRLARELAVDPATLTGTGPGGAITLDDVRRGAAGAPKKPEVAPDRMRDAIARAMARSKREIPHYYVAHTVDLAPALAWLEAENARRAPPDRLIVGLLFVKATALALRRFPELNSRWEDDHAVENPAIHVGVAISLRGGGLVAPALHDTDRRGLGDLMSMFRDLVERARSGRLKSSELADPTITVTSLGERGVQTVFGIIFPPQVALVGFGTVTLRPWIVGGGVAPRPLVDVTLSADHRVSDGHRGALFLATIAELLSEPGKL